MYFIKKKILLKTYKKISENKKNNFLVKKEKISPKKKEQIELGQSNKNFSFRSITCLVGLGLIKNPHQNLINTKYFYSNQNFTDSGLTNLGKSLKTLPTLNSISLNFNGYLKNLI